MAELIENKFKILFALIDKMPQLTDYGAYELHKLYIRETCWALAHDDIELYNRKIFQLDLSNNIDEIFCKLKKYFETFGVYTSDYDGPRIKRKTITIKTSADIIELYDRYPKNIKYNQSENIKYEMCTLCNNLMILDSVNSELVCENCGIVKELFGTAFDDMQFYSQEGQKAKSGTFNPSRHFLFWWIHITTREPEEEIGDKNDNDNLYGEKVIEQLKLLAKKCNLLKSTLDVYHIRDMLKKINRTDLNKNTALLLKKVTNIGPPQLSRELEIRVENLFTKIIEAEVKIRRSERINRHFYSYYIYKILDLLIPEDDLENRKIFYYIYVQSKTTVESDDDDWKKICEIIPELHYKPTDRKMYLKYKPYKQLVSF